MDLLSRRNFMALGGATLLATQLQARTKVAAPSFKLGLVTYNVPKDWDLDTLLRICKEVGFAAVECRTTHKHGIEPTLKPEERKTAKKAFADSGVVFWGCGSTCEFHSNDRAVVRKNIEECKRFIELVHDLGGKGVKVRPNGVAAGMTAEQACNQIAEALQECGKAAADAGVEIWVEVHGRITALPANMRRIMDACNHPAVGVCWNSNPTDLENGSIATGFDLLAKYIRSCHINDLTNDAKGTYPYRDLFRRLGEIGYDRYTLCEVGKSYDPVAGKQFLADYRALWTKLVTPEARQAS